MKICLLINLKDFNNIYIYVCICICVCVHISIYGYIDIYIYILWFTDNSRYIFIILNVTYTNKLTFGVRQVSGVRFTIYKSKTICGYRVMRHTGQGH